MNTGIKNQIKQCQSRDEADRLLANLVADELSDSDFFFLDRILNKLPSAPDLKLACLASFNPDPLPTYARVLSEMAGLRTNVYVGNYNQYFQEILDPAGKLLQFSPEIVFLSLSLQQLAPELVTSFVGLTTDQKKAKLQDIVTHLMHWIDNALKKTQAIIIITNFPSPLSAFRDISDLNSSYGQTEFFLDLNLALLRCFKSEARVHILDLDQLAASSGKLNIRDDKMYYLAKREWGEQFVRQLGMYLVRFIKASKGLSKKCLVVDLDNTVWGGIVGEDGPSGLRIGTGDPEGEAYLDFQHKIRNLKDRGVILAICSKNNIEDVIEAFEQHRHMPLTLTDFSAIEVNWENKVDNLRRIAASLNIGIDSIVFVDDSPFECNLVREMLPEIKTIQLPQDPARLPSIVDQITDFDRLAVTKEDVEKNLQYSRQHQRETHKQSVADLDAYLHSLNTEVVIRGANEQDLQRVHQLFTKTNQFNLSTIRYPIARIEEFISNREYELFVVEARDKFGDLGNIGLYLVHIQGGQHYLDSFILSCRAIGRGIETAMMNHVKISAKRMHSETLQTRYIPTKKNKPIANLCEEQGFKLVDMSLEGVKKYSMSIREIATIACDWIDVKLLEDE